MTKIREKEAPEAPTARSGEARTYFVSAAALVIGTYLCELFHLLEEPLFSKVYYGNLNAVFYSGVSAACILALTLVLRRGVRERTGTDLFRRRAVALGIGRKAALYVMTVVPVLLVAVTLGLRFKLVYELGEKITGMTLLGNACGFVLTAAKLLAAVYFIFLVDEGALALSVSRPAVPFGGAAALCTFGVLELVFEPSKFSLLYMFLFFYCGVIARVSGRRFGVTYAISLVLFLL